jgi:hypothetical protein
MPEPGAAEDVSGDQSNLVKSSSASRLDFSRSAKRGGIKHLFSKLATDFWGRLIVERLSDAAEYSTVIKSHELIFSGSGKIFAKELASFAKLSISHLLR